MEGIATEVRNILEDSIVNDLLMADIPTICESDFAAEQLALQWAADIEEEYIRNGPVRRKADIEARRIQAETAINIKLEDARRDLYVNSRNPFLFRKYMKEYERAMILNGNGWWDTRAHEVRGELGRHILGSITCQCNFRPLYYDTSLEWTFEPYGNGSSSLRDVCNQHTNGRCSEGTSYVSSGTNHNGQGGLHIPDGALQYKEWRDEGKKMEQYDVV
jgi:hypothetical protein